MELPSVRRGTNIYIFIYNMSLKTKERLTRDGFLYSMLVHGPSLLTDLHRDVLLGEHVGEGSIGGRKDSDARRLPQRDAAGEAGAEQ